MISSTTRSSRKLTKWLESQGRGSGAALAKALDVTPGAVSRWASAATAPSWAHRLALQIICDTDPNGWELKKPVRQPIPQDLERRAREYAAQLRAA